MKIRIKMKTFSWKATTQKVNISFFIKATENNELV